MSEYTIEEDIEGVYVIVTPDLTEIRADAVDAIVDELNRLQAELDQNKEAFVTIRSQVEEIQEIVTANGFLIKMLQRQAESEAVDALEAWADLVSAQTLDKNWRPFLYRKGTRCASAVIEGHDYSRAIMAAVGEWVAEWGELPPMEDRFITVSYTTFQTIAEFSDQQRSTV